MRYIAIILSFISLGSWAQNTTTTVQTKLLTDTIMIGDQITMQVSISKDVATELLVPQFENGQLSPDIEIIGMPIVDTTARDGRSMTVRLNYLITSFKAGTHRLSGFPVVVTSNRGNDTIVSDDHIQLVVKTFEIDTTSQQIIDIKQPLDTPLQWAEIKEIVMYSIGAMILLAVLSYFLIRYLKSRRRLVEEKPTDPAHVIAIRKLEELGSAKLAETGQFKEYYSRLTDTVREYLENRYQIGAMEMTTPQIIEALKAVNTAKLVDQSGELFSLADLVKFAKWTPTTDDCLEAFKTAYNYIETTKEEPENIEDNA